MSSQFQATGWINTTKSSNSSTKKSKAAPRRLRQTSLQDFLKRKQQPKEKRREKENRHVIAPTNPKKRKKDEDKCHDGEGVAKKRHKKDEGDLHDPTLELVGSENLRWAQDLGDDPSSPYIIFDNQAAVSWDDTTVWDSATTSRTIRVEPPSVASSPSEGRTISKEGGGSSSKTILKSLKLPTSPTKQRSVSHVLAVDESTHRYTSSDNPFIASLPPRALTEPHDTVIPSSQSQEIEWFSALRRDIDLLPSSQTLDTRFPLSPLPTGYSSCYPEYRRVRTISNEPIVPSSQSQYLLPYNASPPRPSSCASGGSHDGADHTEIIPSSQSQMELELQMPSQYRCGSPSSMVGANAADSSTTSIACDSMLGAARPPRSPQEEDPVTTPIKRALTSQAHLESASTAVRSCTGLGVTEPPGDLSHSPPCQHETLSSAIVPTSPPRILSSQSGYTYSEESYPPEVTEFLDALDDDRGSLGSQFRDSQLGLSVEGCGNAARGEDGDGHEVGRAGPGKTYRPESPQRHAQSGERSSSPPPESHSPIRIPVDRESQYTFIEESYPPEVTYFLDLLDQDRSSLGSDFQGSSLSGSLEENGNGEDGRAKALHAGLPRKTFRSESSPPHEPSIGGSGITSQSLSPVRVPVDQESQYTFMEESYPPDVTNFLDNVDQDRGSLGSEFQWSIQAGSL